MNRIPMLRVKIKSLAEEARIIRREECRALSGSEKYRDLTLYRELRDHRVKDVRAEQRASLLAYAFLRGKSRAQCEPKTSDHPLRQPDWKRVLALVEKFGELAPTETKAQRAERLTAWQQGTPAVAV